MGWFWGWWPWGPHKGKKKVEKIHHPCLLIPGIGGSILNAVSQNGATERVWVRLFKADGEFRRKIWSKYNPATGRTESLSNESVVVVPTERAGLYSCDSLDPDLPMRLDVVYYYHDMIEEMKSWGYEEGESLFGFGFDFRQSNRLEDTLDLLKIKLEHIYETSGGKKVDVVTHSMGGLMFKSFLVYRRADFERLVNKWVAIACPFQGAPGFIMDTLLTGVEFVKGWRKELFIAKWTMHQLVVECPSIYEMFANKAFAWKEQPELRIWIKDKADQPAYLDVSKMDTVDKTLADALRDNTMDLDGEKIPLPFNDLLAVHAEETQKAWNSAQLPPGFLFYNVFGTSYDTPFHCTYGTQAQPVTSRTELLHTEAQYSNVEGDGTVPMESARADGMRAYCRIGIPGDHRGILNDRHVYRMLHHFLRVGEFDPDYDPATDAVMVPSAEEIEEEIARARAAAAQKARLAELEKEVVASIERGDFEEGNSGDLVVHFRRRLDEAREEKAAAADAASRQLADRKRAETKSSGSDAERGGAAPGTSAVRHPPTTEERLAAKALRAKETAAAARQKPTEANAYVEVDDLYVSAHAVSSPCGSPDVRRGCCCGPSVKTTVSVEGGKGDRTAEDAVEVAARAAADGARVKAAEEEGKAESE